MSTPSPRRLIVDLPPLTVAQADVVFQLLADLQDAFWCAYEDELLDAATQHAAAVEHDQREAEALDAIWDMPADRT